MDLIANVCLVCAVNKDYSGRSGGPRSIPSYIVLNVLDKELQTSFFSSSKVKELPDFNNKVMISGTLILNAGG